MRKEDFELNKRMEEFAKANRTNPMLQMFYQIFDHLEYQKAVQNGEIESNEPYDIDEYDVWNDDQIGD
jgi:hypothetical protein